MNPEFLTSTETEGFVFLDQFSPDLVDLFPSPEFPQLSKINTEKYVFLV